MFLFNQKRKTRLLVEMNKKEVVQLWRFFAIDMLLLEYKTDEWFNVAYFIIEKNFTQVIK